MITLQSRPQKQDKGNVGSGDEIDYPYGATLKGSFQEQRLWSLKVEVNHAPAILRCEKADIYNSFILYPAPHQRNFRQIRVSNQSQWSVKCLFALMSNAV